MVIVLHHVCAGVSAAVGISSLKEFEGREELGFGSFSEGYKLAIRKINLSVC